jgi:protein-disulfide isomerase
MIFCKHRAYGLVVRRDIRIVETAVRFCLGPPKKQDLHFFIFMLSFENMENSKLSKFVVPGAIIVAGLIIGGAIYYDRKSPAANAPSQNQAAAPAASPLDNLKPVTDKDHILGNPDAPVTIVTFTDLECPFCKRFHITMQQIMEEYGKTGKVKWVFRQLPLTQLHSKSQNEAAATECAADLGGNDAFWKYVDRIFEITPSNDGLDPAELLNTAEYAGLDKAEFEKCLASGRYDQLINDQFQNAINSGALGSPYAVIIGPNGKKTAIPGAYPYEDVKAAIDEMLK